MCKTFFDVFPDVVTSREGRVSRNTNLTEQALTLERSRPARDV